MKLHILKWIATAVLAATGMAHAIAPPPYTVGTLTSYGNSVAYDGGTSFSDVFTFSIASPSQVFTGTLNNPVFVSGFSNLNLFSSFAAALTGPTGATFVLSPYGPPATPNGQSLDYSGYLSVGDYSLTVTGATDPGKPGGYTINLNAVAAVVPEPETYGMLLAGLGLVLTMVRRRRSDDRHA